jgi:hypothetical protein
MASNNILPHSQPPSVPSSPGKSRPPYPRHSSGRSTLRSAEEQLRDIREGDTSWQLNGKSPRRSTTPPKLVLPNGDGRDTTPDRGIGRGETVRVYLHNTQKTDTLPMILLAYEISATVLKKANRLWATDSIQSRRKLYLPVEECGIKAEPCAAPRKPAQPSEVSNTTIDDDAHRSKEHGDCGDWPPRLQGYPPTEEPEEWVTIPGIGPIQIVSLAAHKLSYFPTPRRNTMERSTSLPTLDTIVAEDATPRDSMDSVGSRSSIGSLVEDGFGRVVRFWHDNQGRKKWAKIGGDLIEM